ncbi:MAG TPA: universal stress protein [Bacteroidales bacterium]|nr:universal stress protein [Bacteroidales bacterium]
MKRAILTTDLSSVSDLLLNFLPDLKKIGTNHITLLHVPVVSFSYTEYSGYSMMVHIEARLLSMKKKICSMGFETDFVIREGLPSQEIVDFAKKYPEAVIIIGSKGYGFARRNLIGSTTLRVIQQSKNPVLLVKIKNIGKNSAGQDECGLEQKELLQHGLFLTDFSENANQAFTFAKNFIASKFQQFTILHVQDAVSLRHHDQKTIDNFNQIDADRLQAMTEDLRVHTGAKATLKLTHGSVVPEIMREAKLNQASLIIMGKHGRSFFSDIVLGSTITPVIQLVESNCLLIPLPDERGPA